MQLGGEPAVEVCVHYCKRDPLWVFGHSFLRGQTAGKAVKEWDPIKDAYVRIHHRLFLGFDNGLQVSDGGLPTSVLSSRSDFTAFTSLGKAGLKPLERAYYCAPKYAKLSDASIKPPETQTWLVANGSVMHNHTEKACSAVSSHGGGSTSYGLTVCKNWTGSEVSLLSMRCRDRVSMCSGESRHRCKR